MDRGIDQITLCGLAAAGDGGEPKDYRWTDFQILKSNCNPRRFLPGFAAAFHVRAVRGSKVWIQKVARKYRFEKSDIERKKQLTTVTFRSQMFDSVVK